MNPNKWIVLFGGAGREGIVERMLMEGIDVEAIFVPARRIAKLENAVSKLRGLRCSIIEVDRSDMSNMIAPFYGSALLSIGFPYIVPEDILEHFIPALNVHPTLLPKYRGGKSGAYVLLNNEQKSGSTIHHMTNTIDCGDIVVQSDISISPFDTIRSVQRKVYAREPELVIEALAAVENCAQVIPQDNYQCSEVLPNRTPEDSEVDPTLPLIELINIIRASDPDDFPAFFEYHGQKVGIKLWRLEKPPDEFDMI